MLQTLAEDEPSTQYVPAEQIIPVTLSTGLGTVALPKQAYPGAHSPVPSVVIPVELQKRPEGQGQQPVLRDVCPVWLFHVPCGHA